MSTVKRVFKNTMFLYLRMLISIVFSFFTTRILLQALGVSDFGLYNVIAGSVAMLGFFSASMSSATQRFLSFAEGEGEIEKIKDIFANSVFLHRIIALVVTLFLVSIGFILFNGALSIPNGRFIVAISVYGCMIISTIYAITIAPYDAVLNARENMRIYSFLGIFDVFAKLLIALSLLKCKCVDRLLFYGVLMAIESQAYRFLTKRYCILYYSDICYIGKTININKKILFEIASFAGWNMLNISTGMISLYGMGISINHFFGTVLNASLGIASQVAGVLMGVSNNMTKALTPVLVKSEGRHEREKMINLSLTGCKYSFLLFSFLGFPIAFSIRPLLSLWLVEVPDYTEIFCILLLFSTLIEQLFAFLFYSINAHGNVRNYNICRSVFNLLAVLVMCISFSMGFPAYHALLDWIIFKAVFGGLVNVYYAWRNFGLPIRSFFRLVLAPCLKTSLFVCVIMALLSPSDSDTLGILVVRILAMFILCLPIYWKVSMTKYERSLIYGIFKSKCNK